MTIDTFISEAFEQWLGGEVSPEKVRAIESGTSAAALWQRLLESGFADLLVTEAKGGAGGNLETVCQMIFACGADALPLALPTTLWVRAVLAQEGLTIPEGAIALAIGQQHGQAIQCTEVAFGTTVDWALVALGDGAWLLPVAEAEQRACSDRSLLADFTWHVRPHNAVRVEAGADWQAIGAAIFAALIAGAASRVLSLALSYANDRRQFGQPLAKFQAIQQQLSVLAEQVFAVRMASQLALRGEGLQPPRLLAAVAKARASESVGAITSIGHMVHGAIGITEEYDLQLFTRRLHEWRSHFGGETFWQRELGAAVLEQHQDTLGFIRELSQAG